MMLLSRRPSCGVANIVDDLLFFLFHLFYFVAVFAVCHVQCIDGNDKPYGNLLNRWEVNRV